MSVGLVFSFIMLTVADFSARAPVWGLRAALCDYAIIPHRSGILSRRGGAGDHGLLEQIKRRALFWVK